MKQLIEYLIFNIVKNPKEVVVEEGEEDNYLNILIKVNPEDIKIVIGKNGQTIKAIREIARIKALKEGKIVNIKIKE